MPHRNRRNIPGVRIFHYRPVHFGLAYIARDAVSIYLFSYSYFLPMSLQEYLQQVNYAIQAQSGAVFKSLISINPGANEGPVRANFNDPNDFDLYLVPEKFKPVIRVYLKLMKSVYVLNDIDVSFFDLNDLVNLLNRAAESQTNWINLALINSCCELTSVYKVRLKNFPDEQQLYAAAANNDEFGANSSTNSLELLAATINKSFKLCLNDKNLDLSQSKRTDIFFFLGSLIKIYFKLNNLQLAKSVEKAIVGTRFSLPDINNARNLAPMVKTSMVTYLYYSALLSLDDNNFAAAEEKLLNCINILSYTKKSAAITPQLEKIFLILLPLRLYNKRHLPSAEIWSQFPRLRLIYRDNLFDAISTGNVGKFNQCLHNYQFIFLQNYLYYLIENLRSLCYLKLVKKVSLLINDITPDGKSNHIIALSAVQLAFESASPGSSFSLDSIECILANLIHTGKIKGYLSHANRCIVLSKVNGFPGQVAKQ